MVLPTPVLPNFLFIFEKKKDFFVIFFCVALEHTATEAGAVDNKNNEDKIKSSATTDYEPIHNSTVVGLEEYEKLLEEEESISDDKLFQFQDQCKFISCFFFRQCIGKLCPNDFFI